MNSMNNLIKFISLGFLIFSGVLHSCKKKEEVIPPINFNPSITYDSMSDQDGNVYKIVTIGTQIWMAENLKTTKYNNGTLIHLETNNNGWYNLVTSGYCWYNNDIANKANYGALYNWYAVNTGKLCPTGWHVPSDSEWTTLITYLGGEAIAGGKLKESGITHWNSPNDGATNESGFTALPGGYRRKPVLDISFWSIGTIGLWWSSTEENETNTWRWGIGNEDLFVTRYSVSKSFGFGYSIRCAKD
jgi:uncharacterized protein (TIGR02145 family)